MSLESLDTLGRPRRKGSTSALLVDAFFRLSFLKVIVVDIGISLGDMLTDFLQGVNLILDFSDWTLRLNSLSYGAAIILVSWLPMVLAFLHLGFSEDYMFLKICRTRSGLIGIILASIFFPFVPTLLYIWLLLSPRQTAENRAQYKMLERVSHEIKSICGAVESPVQLTILSYLMIRGILTLPWTEGFSSKCMTDSLGRVACFPSIPMASMIFSLLSIVKAVFDLNIYPLLREYHNSARSFKMSLYLMLSFLPFFLSNALFRVCSFSIMFVFLDYWSIIPCLILFLLNLIVFGVSFGRQASSGANSE